MKYKTRAINVLAYAGFIRIDYRRLQTITEKELRGYKGCGEKVVEDVKEIITLLTGRVWTTKS